MWKRFKKLSNGVKFAIVGILFLLLAGAIMLTLALCLHWNVAGFFTHPVVIICYALIGIGLTYIVAYYVRKKIKGE